MSEIAFVIEGTPRGKPRMTQRDRWMKRPEVLAYRSWADTARARYLQALPPGRAFAPPSSVTAVAYFGCPLAWSGRKRREMAGMPHRVKPDVDNIAKGLLDALFERDQEVHRLALKKLWDDGQGARLVVMLEF